MTLRIRLLGRPAIEGGPGLRGRKAWALLSYLLTAENPASREQLAGLLFEEADDPLRALRWNLSELRKALPGAEVSRADSPRLILPPDSVVDVDIVKSGSWVEAIELDGLGQELLEGVHLASSPTMETWLLNERRHVKAATEAVLREAVLALLGLDRAGRAVDLASKLAALDPLDEDYQALLIRTYRSAGDDPSARAHAESYERLLQAELGVAPGPAIAQALIDDPAAKQDSVAADPAAISARIEVGEAAIRAGQVEAGLTALRPAAAAAHAIGDARLRARALLAAGSALVHTDRSNHEQGSALLHQVISIAKDLDEPAMIATAHRELAWVEFLAARYERARRWIFKAPAEALEDAATRAGALWILGKSAAETGRYDESFELLDSAIAQAKRAQDPIRLCYCLAASGRGRLMRRELDHADDALREAIEVVRFAGLARLAALPEAFLGEVEVLRGDLDSARTLLDHSLPVAREVGDPTMESLSLRAQGTLAGAEGSVEAALGYLQQARVRMIESPDHTWTHAYVLDRLADVAIEHDVDGAATWVDELAGLAGRTGMKEMLARAYMYRYRLGDGGAIESARLLAHDVDNPQLHADVDSARPLASIGRASGSST